MRLLLIVIPFLILAGCDKPIHEAHAPISWTGSQTP